MWSSTYRSTERTFSFGQFKLIPTRQLLLKDGVPIHLGSRALDILTTLVQRRGELVSKDELIAATWPNVFVHESNLKVNVSILRRSLGDTQKIPTYVATVAGRGYRFVAPVEMCISEAADRTVPARSQPLEPGREKPFGRPMTAERVRENERSTTCGAIEHDRPVGD